jgi:NAD(P)H-dependent FMN reductase
MNRSMLDVVRGVASDHASISDFDGLAAIAAFNPEADEHAPEAVAAWRRQLADADVVLIAAPEYAGSLPGSLKNALDWIVGSGELYGKPVALVSAGTTGGVHARRALVQTLTWQGAHVVGSLGVASPRTKVAADGTIVDPATLAAVDELTRGLLAAPALDDVERLAIVRRIVDEAGVDATHIAPVIR